MRRVALVAVVLAIAISSVGMFKANAVENGADATGNEFVVPIQTQVATNSWISCSGALIAPTVAVTAAHCVVDNNGLVTNNVYVGQAGSSLDSVTKNDIVKKVEITSTYAGGANSTVGNDDLAFLVLSVPQTLRVPMRLASESEVTSYKSGSVPLKVIGYGCYSDACTERTTFPKSFTGVYSQTPANFANSAYLQSTVGHGCSGDSGGPVITTTPTSVVLVGITTGVSLNVHCGKIWTDGTYYTLFTLISRYSNLAFGAASSSITDLLSQLKEANNVSDTASQNLLQANGKNSDLQAENASLVSQVSTLKGSLADAQTTIASLNDEIAILKTKVPVTISCVKGKVTQKVTAVNAKCPAGFKPKP